jgi:TonB-dependent SusC/RagA subfamily outer membrane receptor
MVRSSADLNNTEFYIIGQTRGVMYHREKGKIERGSALINIPKAKLPDGIFHITLFDVFHKPHCERLVFIDNDNEIIVNMETESEVLRSRGKIKLDFELTDQFDRSIRNTRFSVAVTDAGHLVKQPLSENIMTNLLLSSDLRGRITDPGYYFMKDDRDTKIALDLVMLTHGWSRFTWKEIFDHSIAETTFSHEYGLSLTGVAYREGTKNELKNAYINFMSLNDEFPGYWSTTTGIEGTFSIINAQIPDTIQVVTVSLNDRGNPVNIDINIDPITPYMAKEEIYQQYQPPVDEQVLKYLNRFEERKKIEEAYDFSDRIVLKEIEIRGDRYDNKIYGEPDNVIIVDDRLRTFPDIFQIIQGRVPGVVVTGQGMNTQIRIRGVSSFTGNNDPLIVLDGIPVSNLGSSSGSFSAADSLSGGADGLGPDLSNVNSLMLSISPMNVDRIEILKGPSAAAFGVRGANGVILIYTRRGFDREVDSRSTGYEGIRLPGFSYVKEFYSPSYDVPKEEHIIPDKRTTLYWNPSVTTDNLGKAAIEFFNSDEARSLQVEIQGVTDYGDLINANLIVGRDLIK